MVPSSSARVRAVRFGVFEADLQSGELRKQGLKIKLQDQPFQILAMLVERPGQLVTREEINQRLWPTNTFVDFDHGLNNAVNRLREALTDSADTPRFIETIPRRGYRFIAAVDGVGSAERVTIPATPRRASSAKTAVAATHHFRKSSLALLGAISLVCVLLAANVGGLRRRLLDKPNPNTIHSIAVLPLENLTGDPEQEYFVDGMTEALITDLAQINTLTVISQTSAMRYRGSHKSLPEIARLLNVEGVVEGAVARSGNRVRVDAQLIYGPTDQHFWAKSYERSMSDILLLQSEVAQAIADEIRAKLTPPERARLASARPVNTEAYENYIKGRHFWDRRTEEGVRKGIAYFQQAIQLDPGYAAAYAGLADSYIVLAFGATGAMSADEARPKAKAAAQKALELESTLAEAHSSLGFIKTRSESDSVGAEKELQRAIELNPGYANAYLWYSQLLDDLGRYQEALEKAKRAVQLEPASAIMQRYFGILLIKSREYDQAIDHLRLATELDPSLDFHLDLGYAYLSKGMLKEAITEERMALKLSLEEPAIKAVLAQAYALSGSRAEAEKLLAELKVQASEPDFNYAIAGVCVALGRKGEALAWLERAFQGHSYWMAWVPYDWGLDSLRSDPRFQELLKRYGVSADVPASH